MGCCQNTGLVISLNSDCIALVPLWPKSRAVSQIFAIKRACAFLTSCAKVYRGPVIRSGPCFSQTIDTIYCAPWIGNSTSQLIGTFAACAFSLIASVGEAHRANTTLIAQTRTFITHQFTEVSGESICGQIHFF